MHAATLEQVVIPASSLEDSHVAVYQFNFVNVSDVSILGSSLFTINNSSYLVYNTATIPPGSYALTIMALNATGVFFAYLTVDVTPNGKENVAVHQASSCA